jgi:hypothetical protein
VNLTITASNELGISPETMGRLFWEMGSTQQVRFFEALADAIAAEQSKPRHNTWSNGEMQWVYLAEDLQRNEKARDMLMSMAAPLFLHTIRSMEGSL